MADKVDPNTADWSTLAALPMVGEKRARDIVSYRETFAAQRPDELPFKRMEDLLHIPGFGNAIITHLRPHLLFPTTAPSARPN